MKTPNLIPDTPPPDTLPPAAPSPDWPGIIFLALLLPLFSVLTYVAHAAVWTIEQFVMMDGTDWPVYIWPAVALAQGLLLAVPAGIVGWLWKRPRYRAVFQTLALSGALAFFLIPARFAPVGADQLAALLQILGMLAYAAAVAGLIRVRTRRGGVEFIQPAGARLPALLLAALLLYGWLAWGALGSPLDTLLNGLAALLLGLAAGLIFGHFLLPALRRTGAHPGWDVALGGFVIGAALAAMAAGFGVNGLQFPLMFVLPGMGWLLVGLAYLPRGKPESRWLAVALLVGLVAAAPGLFTDPDELLLVLNMGSRDAMTWNMYATLGTLLGGWLLGLLLGGLVLLGDRVPKTLPRRALGVMLGLAWLLAGGIYLFAGQPGFHGERLFVILEDQADLSAIADIPDYQLRRQTAYDTLVGHANTTQDGIRKVLDFLRFDYTSYYLINALEIEGGPLVRLWLTLHPAVDRVLDSPVLRPLPALPGTVTGMDSAPAIPQWNLTMIGADRVWDELGVTGAGIVVGQSDSGVQGDHPELAAAYRGQGGQHDYNWFDPWNHSSAPTDIGGHGTHTLGSILGQRTGVAPGATWYGCVNLARNLANPALYLDCMQFMLAPFPLGGNPLTNGDPVQGAHVINNSWGCPEIEGCDPEALLYGVRALRAAGVFVVASAGNEGASGCESVSDPIAIYDESFSVGAVNQYGGLAGFSSRGPVTVDGSNRTKPDILAPGVDVLSAYPGGTYSSASGTSMAGPHMVGVVALMWSANSNLLGDIDLTEQILIETAVPYDYAVHGTPACAGGTAYPNNAVGYGVVDAFAAVQRALELGE